METYSEAVGLFDQPKIWFDGCSYRLLEVDVCRTTPEPCDESLLLTFGLARYFDGQDTSEFLAYEAADRDAQEIEYDPRRLPKLAGRFLLISHGAPHCQASVH